MQNINRLFIISLTIAVLGVISGTFSNLQPVVIFTLGLLPLVYYFINLLI